MAEKDTKESNFKLRSTRDSVSTHEKLLTCSFLLFKGPRSFKDFKSILFYFLFVHLAPAPQTQLRFSYWSLIPVGWPMIALLSRRLIRRPITDLLIRLFDLSRPQHEDPITSLLPHWLDQSQRRFVLARWSQALEPFPRATWKEKNNFFNLPRDPVPSKYVRCKTHGNISEQLQTLQIIYGMFFARVLNCQYCSKKY
jgi:hypothetical protein